MKNNAFLKFLIGYCEDLIKRNEDDENSTGVVETAFLVAELHRYSLSIENNYFNLDVVKEYKKYKRNKEYKKMADLVYNEYKTAYLPLTIKWNLYPNLLSRHFMVPMRATMTELMVAILALIRSEGYHLVSIENNHICFNVYEDEYSYGKRDAYDALEVLVADFAADTLNYKLIYDFGDDWTFNISRRKPKYILDNTKNQLPFILEKAKGYGIFEDNIGVLVDSIEHPNDKCDFDDTLTNIEAVPFDFNNADITDDSLEEMYSNYDIMLDHYIGLDDYNDSYDEDYEDYDSYDEDDECQDEDFITEEDEEKISDISSNNGNTHLIN